MTIKEHNPSTKSNESGQALVMSAGILFILTLAFLFYMSVQRAYNLANLLDETAELAAQSAAEPIADQIVNGRVRIDPARAEEQAIATVRLLADVSPETSSTIVLPGDPDIESTIKIEEIVVINPGDTLLVEDPLCRDVNLDPTDDDCNFPIVAVSLSLPHRLFGINFNIRTRGIATLGSNSAQPEAIPVTLDTPTPLPTAPPIVITVGP